MVHDGLDFFPVQDAARVDGDGLRADGGAVRAIGAEAGGVVEEALQKAFQDASREGWGDDGVCGGGWEGGGGGGEALGVLL